MRARFENRKTCGTPPGSWRRWEIPVWYYSPDREYEKDYWVRHPPASSLAMQGTPIAVGGTMS